MIINQLTTQDQIGYFIFFLEKNLNVVFECHQLSKIRKWTLKKSIKHRNSKVVFLNKQLLIDSKINNSMNKFTQFSKWG